MIVRRTPVNSVMWGNGSSARYIVANDGLPYSFNDTVIFAGTKSKLQYTNHVESVYCVSGHGVVEMADGTQHPIGPGDIYILDEHDAHTLVAGDEDWRVMCIFIPGLRGDEVHRLSEGGYSGFALPD